MSPSRRPVLLPSREDPSGLRGRGTSHRFPRVRLSSESGEGERGEGEASEDVEREVTEKEKTRLGKSIFVHE